MSNDPQALALCPFCGGEAGVDRSYEVGHYYGCNDCGVWQLGASAWNRRASPAGEAVQEQPLTNEQREAEFARWNYAPDALLFYRMGPAERTKRTFFDGMAAAERANGIGQLGDTGTTKEKA